MTKKVYLGLNNATRVTFYRSGAAFDFSGVTKFVVTFRDSNVVVDSTIDVGKINFAIGLGQVDFFFGDIGILPGTYSLKITLTSDNGEEILTDFDDNLQFNFVEVFDFDLIVQTDSGSEAESNSYITLDFFKQYHKVRGGAFSEYDDFEIKQAIVRAFDFVDSRFKYVSEKLTETQNSEWPRYGYAVIPRAIKEASAEYALRALTKNINPDPDNIANGRLILSKSEGIGPLSESYTYDQNAGDYVMPNYPVADRKIEMAGLVASVGTSFLIRG